VRCGLQRLEEESSLLFFGEYFLPTSWRLTCGTLTLLQLLTGSLETSPADPIKRNQKTKKPSVLLGSDGFGCVQTGSLMTPTGSELSANSLGNHNHSNSVPPPVPPSGSIIGKSVDADTSELLSIWSALDDSARRDLLSVARSWVGGAADAAGRGADAMGIDTRQSSGESRKTR
jgi:hypothetical protein